MANKRGNQPLCSNKNKVLIERNSFLMFSIILLKQLFLNLTKAIYKTKIAALRYFAQFPGKQLSRITFTTRGFYQEIFLLITSANIFLNFNKMLLEIVFVILYIDLQISEAATGGSLFLKRVLKNVRKIHKKNTCTRVSFLIK